LNHNRWNLLPPAPDEYLVAFSGFPRLVAQLLYNRGLVEPSQVESFTAGDERLLADPFLLPDMHQAVARIYQALLSGENIAVYGDFDVDGITATALMVQGLSALGGKVVPYIPHRMTEGHGLKTAALESLYKQGVSLIITVDCGITGFSQVKKAQKNGFDIIITDHHTTLDIVPPAFAVINPRRADSAYSFPDLAGVGVAFKLLQALFQSIGREKELEKLLGLVALGTIADSVPLLGENRYLVKRGLECINTSPCIGLEQVIKQAGLSAGGIDSERVSWVIAPRLNAAGRLAHAITSYNLLMTGSPQEAYELVIWLEQKNAQRQKLTTDVLAKAREQVLAEGVSPILVVSGNDYPLGIAGLVASRLVEEFYRPAIVIKKGELVSGGSCRSIPEFNIILALSQYSNLFSHFGGHAQAAGFTLPTRNLPRLKKELVQLAAAQLAGVDLRPHLDIDVELTLPDLSGDTFQFIQQLAPFGYGNRPPTFLSRGVEVIDCRCMGNNGGHLRLKLRQGGTIWDGVGFRLGSCLTEVSPFIDIVYNLEIDKWGGDEKLRVSVIDFSPVN
jgi:single-stranded-DNA-specific exonuclease